MLSDREEIISAALNAFKNFDYTTFTLKQIPDIFREKLVLPSEFTKLPANADQDPVDVLPYVPGDCWRQLIQNINHSAIEPAADLVGHYIGKEIAAFRGGVYLLPEGHPEPRTLNQLHQQSPLKSIIKYLVNESGNISNESSDLVKLNCLRSISRKFPKPIPPMNWSFLTLYLNRNYEMKKYCLLIASNQCVQSATAQRLLEEYLQNFNIDNCSGEDEMEFILEILPTFIDGMATDVTTNITKFIFEYAFTISKSSGFEAKCLFEKILKNIQPVFVNTFTKVESVDNIAEIVKNYFDLIDIESRVS